MADISAIESRAAAALDVARQAGALALGYFRDLGALSVEQKGHQDLVSEADRAVETLIREEIGRLFPNDSVLGEEQGLSDGKSGFVWVCDPIDGTANFVAGIPQWCVSIAVAKKDAVVIGVIYDPCADDMVSAVRGQGLHRNGQPLPRLSPGRITEGSVGVGLSNRIDFRTTTAIIDRLLAQGGMFFRNASGALMLSYVATGRLIGYIEPHMNAWDCLAGLLLVEEAGGQVLPYDVNSFLSGGGYVLAARPGVYEICRDIAGL